MSRNLAEVATRPYASWPSASPISDVAPVVLAVTENVQESDTSSLRVKRADPVSSMNAKSVRARESTMLRKKMLRPQLSDLRHLVDSSDEDEDADVQTTIEVAGTIHRHLNQLFTPEGAAANEDTQQLWSDIKALRGTDAKAVVQFLDKKVEQMNTQDRASYCASLRLLRRLCAENQIYPKSVTLPPRRLQILSDQAEAFGGSSRVYQGQYDNTHVAVKVIATSRESQFDTSVVKRFFREAVIWRHLRHRNITAFYGVDTSVFSLCLVSEWMPLGTVSQFLTSRPRTNRTKLLQDVAHGLAYLHALDIVHADVKSANVLVDDQHNAKLIDSGIATITTTATTGTTRWAASEVLDPELVGREESTFTPECDIYSLSMTMWEVYTGLPPFHQCNNDGAVIHKVLSRKRPSRPPQPASLGVGLTDTIWALMEKCWNHDYSKRPNIDDALSVLLSEDSLSENHPPEWPLELGPKKDPLGKRRSMR